MRLLGLLLALALATAACGGATPPPQTPPTGDPGAAPAPPPSPPPAASPPPASPPPAAPPPEAAPPPPPRPAAVDGIPPDAERTASGLATKVLRPGRGSVHPGPRSRVTVHYQGWHPDGTVFDSSYRRGRPATFPLHAVIAGWTEGVQLMVVGEKRRLWIPEDLAYKGMPGRPAGMLIFDVELLAIDE